ncbi:hypothetical protein ABDK00_012590 [Niabella insulamsoli]|uniref:gasdermin n=1 Tax=Niabella insulamsoli TaxID=3144874 RepID=UPI0031FC2733
MTKVLKNLLAEYGYNLVALPREDIAPLMLLYKKGKDVKAVESTVDKLFAIEDAALPVIKRDNSVTTIKGEASVVFDAEAGVSALDWLLKKLKMGNLSAKAAVDISHKVAITYENVMEDKVDMLELDNFISSSEPVEGKFNSFKEKLKDSELYVITHILKSNSFSVTVEDASGTQVDVEASIKGIVDANVNVSKNKNKGVTLTHENADTSVVFAFRAQRIIYDQKSWWNVFKKKEAKFRIIDGQGIVLRADEDHATVPLMLEEQTADL